MDDSCPKSGLFLSYHQELRRYTNEIQGKTEQQVDQLAKFYGEQWNRENITVKNNPNKVWTERNFLENPQPVFSKSLEGFSAKELMKKIGEKGEEFLKGFFRSNSKEGGNKGSGSSSDSGGACGAGGGGGNGKVNQKKNIGYTDVAIPADSRDFADLCDSAIPNRGC